MQHLGEICTAWRSRGKHNHDTCCVKARKGFSNRRFERRFWVLLPPGAKVPRAGARNALFVMPWHCRGIRGDAPQGYLFHFAPLRGHRPLRKVYRSASVKRREGDH